MENQVEIISKIVHCSALSQVLIEDIESSVFDNTFKYQVKQKGNLFIKELDKKLDIMLEENEAQEQLLNYVTILKSKYHEVNEEFKKEITEIVKGERS